MIKFAHIRQHDIIDGLYQLVGKGGTTIAYEVNKNQHQLWSCSLQRQG